VTFWDPMLERLDRATRATAINLGVVTAIDATALALTLTIAGDTVTGVRWVDTYTPTQGDFVVVVRASTAWVVLGKLSKNLTGGGAKTTVTLPITPTWYRAIHSGGWTWLGPSSQATQGLEPAYAQTYFASIALFESIPALIPPGATVTSAKLAMRRTHGLSWGRDLVSPVVYQHSRTTVPSSGTSPTSILTGAAWRPGSLIHEQTGTWDLPSAWTTALLAGTTRGFLIYSDKATDYAEFEAPSGRLTITYEI